MQQLHQSQASFDRLPNELLQKIFQSCDLQTLMNISQVHRHFLNAVHQLTKNVVNLKVDCQNINKCNVKLIDTKTATTLKWDIFNYSNGACRIKFTNSMYNFHNCITNVLYNGRHRNLDMLTATCRIVGRLLTTKMFTVIHLELTLRDDIDNVIFESPVQYGVRQINIYNCRISLMKRIAANFSKPPKILILNHENGYKYSEIKDLKKSFQHHGIEEVYFGIFPNITTAELYTLSSAYRNAEGSWSQEGFEGFIGWLVGYARFSTETNHIGFWVARNNREIRPDNGQSRTGRFREIVRYGEKLRVIHYADHSEGFFKRVNHPGLL